MISLRENFNLAIRNSCFILLILFTGVFSSYAQTGLEAPTEDHGNQTMDDTVIGNERFLQSSDGRVITYDFQESTDVLDVEIPDDFTVDRIPKIDLTRTEWTKNDADSSVFQAHWMMKNILDVYSSDLGYDFQKVNIAANCADANASAYTFGDLEECWIGIGQTSSSPPSTFAEVDVLAHELAHVLLFNTPLNIDEPCANAFRETICDIVGVYVESQIETPNYMMGEKVPIGLPRDLENPMDCCWINNQCSPARQYIVAERVAHIYYLLSTGTFGVEPLNTVDIATTFLQAAQNIEIGVSLHLEHFRDATLEAVSQQYGQCSREYRSWINAWPHVFATPNPGCTNGDDCPDFIPAPKDCQCVAGTEIIREDITLEGYQFDGNIVVPNGITLTLKGTTPPCTFPPNSGIIVEDGGSLILEIGIVDCCDPTQKWNGIIVEDGGSISQLNSSVRNAKKAIELQGNSMQDLTMSRLFLENCDVGLSLKDVPYFDLSTALFHTYLNCGQAISVYNSAGIISSANVINCDQGIYVDDVSGDLKIHNNTIGYNDQGIFVVRCESEVEIYSNEIGGDHGQGEYGIVTGFSNVNIHDNAVLNADAIGIFSAYTINSGTEATVTNNNIDVSGDLSSPESPNFAYGIRSFFDNGLHVNDNTITGNGLKVGIHCTSGEDNLIEWTTINATNYQNGIAISGGQDNYVQFNEILNDPDNGILNEHSFDNHYIDNDISAFSQGLSIEPLSGYLQTIKCNRFCSGLTDINVESVLGIQQHHHNEFRDDVAKARVQGLLPDDIDASRFRYQKQDSVETPCGYMKLGIEGDDPNGVPNDPDGLFEPFTGSSTENCLENSGSNATGDDDPEVDCDYILELKQQGRWLEIQRLMAAGQYIADCGTIWWCKLLYIGELERELRDALTSATGSPLQNLQATASAQLVTLNQIFSGTEGEEVDPCDDSILEETYRRTYENLLHQIIGNTIDQTEILYLQEVASYCPDEFGDVIDWARGVLAIEGYFSYTEGDCDDIEPREIKTSHKAALGVMQVFPNPVDNLLSVEISGKVNALGMIILQDVTGATIGTWNLSGRNALSIDTNSIPNGFYLLSYKEGQTVVISQKVIIQH